ncbi:hypothetical protein [Pelagibacterium lentulum]|uniref:Uncharacterized protein n=1 Tax=Pelagibacterium lentulum TaxID=2029865 RepID=A0A916RB21_9HYPH|nr:hypothetical protein [Pelagibacterium lentulum]GGA47248.1 hypothetical protein GCM10011499_16280 [Pelagibacterium lentulum]
MTIHFAMNGGIGTDKELPENAIEISAEQYQAALVGIQSGKEVFLEGNSFILRDQAPSKEHAWENGEWVAPPEPEPPIPDPNSPYALYKSNFIERMTPEEAEKFEQELNASELAKLRLMYHAVEYFVSDDPLFAVLHWELTQAFGEDRADELLVRPE